jgi:hypothetical protein
LKPKERKEVLIWLQNLKFAYGYASSFIRAMNLESRKLSRVKSHDYHIFVERLLPIIFHGYLNDNVWKALAKLSHFYRQLCAKEIKKEMIDKMEKEIPVLICKLEKIFPPEWFDPMQHLLVHLPYEAKLGGPQQYRWMYHIKRTLKNLRAMVCNRTRVEGCITEEFKLKEIMYFTNVYFTEHHNVNVPTMQYHVDEDISCSDLQIFQWKEMTVDASMLYQTTQEEQMSTLLYMYANMDEMDHGGSLFYSGWFKAHLCIYSFNLTACSIRNTYLLAGNQWGESIR